jgi:predicted ATP-dependent Lon-type protease
MGCATYMSGDNMAIERKAKEREKDEQFRVINCDDCGETYFTQKAYRAHFSKCSGSYEKPAQEQVKE